MFFDHAITGFLTHESLLTVILHIPGRVVAPIMCYFIAEGYYHTSNLKRYIVRLLIIAVISHFAYNLYFGYTMWEATSVMWGLAMGLIALAAVKHDRFHILIKLFILGVCCLLSVTANWNYIAVLWIVAFGVFRGQFMKQMISFIIIGYGLYAIPTFLNLGWHHTYQFGIILTIPLLALYKGRRGSHSVISKWGFYIFYPAHLFLLYIFKYYVFA